jgi:ribosomal-protein-alanine N-acetyltransferase
MNKKRSQFAIVWEFRIRAQKRRPFEEAYRPDGLWGAFFRKGEGYVRTELIQYREHPLRYLTIDVWESRRHYEHFKKQNRSEYLAIDKQCESLTTSEKRVGEFVTVGEPNSLKPRASADEAVLVRTAALEDIPRILAMERDSPSAAHWPELTYRRMFRENQPLRIVLVASQAGEAALLGFVIARVAADDCELENIVVSRKRQNRGVGTQLSQSLATEARKQNARRIFLEVRESNTAARALYEKCGFAITGRRPSYYTDPIEDAILYTLQL